MSERGKAVCEFIELSRRYQVQTWRAERNIALKGVQQMRKLKADITNRYCALNDSEKAAVDGFIARAQFGEVRFGVNWALWLEAHLVSNPLDAFLLQSLEQNFIRAPDPESCSQYCVDFTWRMHHEW